MNVYIGKEKGIMSKTRKNWAIIIVMVFAVSLLLTSVIMKVKAGETATANLTIYFLESIDSNAEDSITKEITITNFVVNDDGSYSGTINLANENITYEKESGDTRYVVNWYNNQKVPISPTFSLESVSVTDSDGVYEITLYAVYGETIQINLNNNADYIGAGESVIVSKYYPQMDSAESSKTITLPTDPSELASNFMIDGYSFIGWGESDSGDVEVNSAELGYGGRQTFYAHWQDIRPQGSIETAGDYYLEPNIQYILGDGTWTVNGGVTKYPTGTSFYVKKAGTYMLSK